MRRNQINKHTLPVLREHQTDEVQNMLSLLPLYFPSKITRPSHCDPHTPYSKTTVMVVSAEFCFCDFIAY